MSDSATLASSFFGFCFISHDHFLLEFDGFCGMPSQLGLQGSKETY